MKSKETILSLCMAISFLLLVLPLYFYLTLYAVPFLLILAGVLKAVMDRLEDGYEKTIFPQLMSGRFLGFGRGFWEKRLGAGRKWKNRSNNEDGEAFFLSSTALVFLTDG